MNKAIQDVIAERQRQQAVEGWTPEHDDEHQSNELVSAAVEYATHVVGRSWVFPSQPDTYTGEECSNDWPWDESWWKPKSPRQDLVRAAALLIAEIERLDRAGEQP